MTELEHAIDSLTESAAPEPDTYTTVRRADLRLVLAALAAKPCRWCDPNPAPDCEHCREVGP